MFGYRSVDFKRNPQKSGYPEFLCFCVDCRAQGIRGFFGKRKTQTGSVIYDDYSDAINMQTNNIDEYLETEEDACALKHILREISFLSKIYRDVMVLYYLDGMKTAEIAVKLGISENAVKQRLFSARNTVKKEAEKMDNDYTLKPIEIAFVGSGNPVGNDPPG